MIRLPHEVKLQCEGVGGRRKRRKIRSLVMTEDVDMVFLQETKSEAIDIFCSASIWGGTMT